MKIQRTLRTGFSLLEILIVLAIIGLLASIAVPGSLRERNESQKNRCIANLNQLERAKETWAEEKKAKPGEKIPISVLFGEHSYLKVLPDCPRRGVYNYFTVGVKTSCSISGHTL